MSYNDYGDEPRRPSRRNTREPVGPAKIQGSTAAAILVFVAIVGFGIGALIGNLGGDEPETTTSGSPNSGQVGSPDTDASTSPDDAESDEPSADDESTNGPTDPAGGNGISLTSEQDGGDVPSGEGGTIYIRGTTDPPLAETVLIVERSLDNGATWEDAGSGKLTTETDANGNFSTNFWSGRETLNMYRVRTQDGQAVSNTISVNVVSPDEADSSGPGNGNGGNDDD